MQKEINMRPKWEEAGEGEGKEAREEKEVEVGEGKEVGEGN